MVRLLSLLLQPVTQLVLLIGVVGVGGIVLLGTPTSSAPLALPTITPLAGGMALPATALAPQADSITTTVTPQGSPPPTAAAATPSVPWRALSAIPTMANAPVCSCNRDSYSCRELGDSAQGCFAYCMERGQGDVHRLDYNGNGVACEE